MAKKKPAKRWVYSPRKPPPPKVPDATKATVSEAANHLVEEVLKPTHIHPPPDEPQFNYIVDIFTKWYRSYLYFCATYRCPHENCITEFFETRFARLTYAGDDGYHLAFMRYTGEWVEVYPNTVYTLDECLTKIKEDPFFHP
jgi:hypothetical protein